MKGIGARVYRTLLRAFPPAFRRRHSDEMLAQFSDQRRRLRGRPLAAATLWILACLDAIRHGFGLRIERRHSDATASRTYRRRGASWQAASFYRDLRQGIRTMLHWPAYAVTVVAIVALGTALGATVFGMVDGVLFKRLPYPHAEQLYVAYARGTDGRGSYVFKVDEIDAWRRAMPALAVSAFRTESEGGSIGDGRRYGAAAVDEAFFDVLGERPMVGGFVPDHFHPGANRVAIISFRLWKRIFNGRRDVIGQVLPLVGGRDILGRPRSQPIVVGILGPDFVFPAYELPDVVTPLALTAQERAGRNESAARALLRLPVGTTIGQWQSRLDTATLMSQPSGATEDLVLSGVSMEPVVDSGKPMVATYRTLIAAAGVLDVLACVGIVGLTVARARQRERQVLVRRTLGASSWDIYRHAFAEIAPLAIAGAGVAIALTPSLLAFTVSLLPPQTPFLKLPRVDARVLGAAAMFAASCAATVACSVLRISRRARLRVTPVSTTPRVRGFGRALVAVQVGLAFVVALGGALLVASLWRAWQVDPGFERNHLAVVRVSARAKSWPDVEADADLLAGELARLPGVTASGVLASPLLVHARSVSRATAAPATGPLDVTTIYYSGGLLDALGLMPARGRLPTANEIARRDPVVLVSERAAAAFWPGEQAVGQSLAISQLSATVIGVVRDVRFSGLADRERGAGQVFIPGIPARQLAVLLRTPDGPSGIAIAAGQAVRARHRQFDLVWAGTMREALASSIDDHRFSAWVYGGYASCALVITAVGLLGMVAMVTTLRSREIGVRLALGAPRGRIVWLLLREQLAAVVIGLVAGGVVAWWAVDTVRRQLYGVAPTDPMLWVGTALTVLACASLATLLPAIRAAQADPAQTLRADS